MEKIWLPFIQLLNISVAMEINQILSGKKKKHKLGRDQYKELDCLYCFNGLGRFLLIIIKTLFVFNLSQSNHPEWWVHENRNLIEE